MWTTPLSIVIVLCAVISAALLRRGLKGTRTGAERRCATCGYNLTGLRSNNCPECGHLLGRRSAVVRGRRRRSWGVLAGGVIMILVVVAGLGIWLRLAVRSGGLYRHYPFSMVLADARAGDPKGMAEVQRRLSRGSLSTDQERRLADAALEFHGDPARNPAFKTWIDWVALLDALDKKGSLTPSQFERFIRQMLRIDAEADSPIRADQPLAIEFSEDIWGPANRAFILRYTSVFVMVDGTRIRGVDSYLSSSHMRVWGGHVSSIQSGAVTLVLEDDVSLSPGVHTFTIGGTFSLWDTDPRTWNICVYVGSWPAPPTGPPDRRGRFVIRGCFETLP